MLGQCGLEVETVYGDSGQSPLDEDSRETIFVCRRGGYSSAPAASPAMP